MSSDRGAATIVMVAIVGLVAVVGVGTAGVGVLFAAREQANTAAEAAALAAAVATYPPAASEQPGLLARSMAWTNGASLVSCHCRVNTSLDRRRVTVITVVETDVPVLGMVPVQGTARAEFDPRAWLGR